MRESHVEELWTHDSSATTVVAFAPRMLYCTVIPCTALPCNISAWCWKKVQAGTFCLEQIPPIHDPVSASKVRFTALSVPSVFERVNLAVSAPPSLRTSRGSKTEASPMTGSNSHHADMRKKAGCASSASSSSSATRMTTGNLGACMLSRALNEVAMS